MACAGGAKADATASGAFPFGKMTVDSTGWFSAGAVPCPFIVPWSGAACSCVASDGGALVLFMSAPPAGDTDWSGVAAPFWLAVPPVVGCAVAESSSPETQTAVRMIVD